MSNQIFPVLTVRNHYKNTVEVFVNQFFAPSFSSLAYPKQALQRLEIGAHFPSFALASNPVNTQLEIVLRYNAFPESLANSFKKVLNDYFRPYVEGEKVKHYLKYKRQFTRILGAAAHSSINNPMSASELQLDNRNLITAIRVFWEESKIILPNT
jgi:hypothetical protein